MKARGWRRWWLVGLLAWAAILVVAAIVWREDILRTGLDPKQPFQTYEPPPAPDYRQAGAWALAPDEPTRWTEDDGPADIFLIHPTSYDGGHDWNGPIDDRRANGVLARTMLPNYAGPFQRIGRVFAPHYRQASLYSLLTNRDDAREARRFAYGDVKAAFAQFHQAYNRGRPIIIVGVEQGGQLAARLLADVVASDEDLALRVAAIYLIDAVAPAADFAPDAPFPACERRAQGRCVVGWAAAWENDAEARERLQRAYVWTPEGQLSPLAGRPALCVNPLNGEADAAADRRLNLGAANASGLEWGARPGFLPRQVAAACDQGLLRVSRPTAPSLRISGAWADRRKVWPFNVFYADLEADAKARVAAAMNRTDFPRSAPSIDAAVVVGDAPVRRID